MSRAKNVDEYIEGAPEATQPILIKLRRIFRQTSPRMEEVIKWNIPYYVHNGLVGGFVAYKAHVSWGLWKADELEDPDGLIGHGILKGGKIATVADIPPTAQFVALLNEAIALNDEIAARKKTLAPATRKAGANNRPRPRRSGE